MDIERLPQFCLTGLEMLYIPSEHVFSPQTPTQWRVDGTRAKPQSGVRVCHECPDGSSSATNTRQGDVPRHRVPLSWYHGLAARIDEQSGSAEDIAATVWTGRCLGTEISLKVASLFMADWRMRRERNV
jgi:hypothetical protein